MQRGASLICVICEICGSPYNRKAGGQVTALAATRTGLMAVHWPEAALVIFPQVFIDMADKITSPEAPALYLWVDLRAFRNEDGTTGLFTTGLPALGHMEIEIPRIDMDPASSVNGC